MSKYLKLFDTHSGYTEYKRSDSFVRPNVSYCIEQNDVHCNPLSVLKIHYLVSDDTQDTKIIYYYGGDYYTPSLAVNEFDKIYIDGVAVEPSEVDAAEGYWPLSTGEHIITYFLKDSAWLKQPIFRDIPIITSVEMSSSIVRTNANAFRYSGDLLEAEENGLKYADRHLVAVTDKTKSSYELKSNTITIGSSTFGDWVYPNYDSCTNCTSLTTAPELLATTLANRCYMYMFEGCTSLTTAPELPATTLAENCYSGMFRNCSSLTTAPELLATTLAGSCYSYMFYGCTSLTTAPELPATTLANYCYFSMFEGCTSLTTAPELPATTLANYCYQNMFIGCTNLNYIKALFTTTPSNTYTQNWVNGVAASGTFVKNSAAGWNVSGVNGIPDGWTVETASE